MRIYGNETQAIFRSPEKEIVNQGSLRVALTDAATKGGVGIESAQKGMSAVKTSVANESQARSKISSMANKLVKMSKSELPKSLDEAERVVENFSRNLPGYPGLDNTTNVTGLFLDKSL
ncbi:MAG: hypothetical protein GX219_09785 [Tissierellia bacterium]|nr:hypothetical protein [Tissierellia bacterium]